MPKTSQDSYRIFLPFLPKSRNGRNGLGMDWEWTGNGLGMNWEWTRNENTKFIQFLHFILIHSWFIPEDS